MKDVAEKFYTDRRGNCAQSVEHAWTNHQENGSTITTSGSGHGKAADGMCGALFAASSLACETKRVGIIERFKKHSSGHISCRDIRKSKALSCVDCVGVAADILQNSI